MKGFRFWASLAAPPLVACAVYACGGPVFSAAPGGEDSGVSDGGGGGDGGSGDGGGSPDADAAPSAFCMNLTSRHFFCDDFDERAFADTKGAWDSFGAGPKGDGRLDQMFSVSKPRSFLASTTRAVTTEETVVTLAKDVGNAKQVTLSYDLYVQSYGGDVDAGLGDHDFAFLSIITSGPLTYALEALTPDHAFVYEGLSPDGGTAVNNSHPMTTGIAAGQWVHVDITLNLPQPPNAGHVRVAFDMQLVVDADLSFMAPPAADTQVGIGLFLTNAPNLWKVNFDNVVIDKQ